MADGNLAKTLAIYHDFQFNIQKLKINLQWQAKNTAPLNMKKTMQEQRVC